MRKTSIYIISLTLALVGLSAHAAEQDEIDRDSQGGNLQQNSLLPEGSEAASGISRRQASDLARDRFQGRVLNIRMDEDNRWRVRLDQNGRVFNVFVDARSGEISQE